MVLDFAKEAIQNVSTHSINFDELRAGKASIKVFGCGGAGCNTITWLFNWKMYIKKNILLNIFYKVYN